MPMESSCPFSSFNATTCQLANSFPQQSIGPFVKAANNGICQTEVESTVCSLGKQIDRKVTGQGGQPGGHSLGNSHKRNNPIYILYCAIIRGTVRGVAKGSWFPPHSEAISRFQLHNNPTSTIYIQYVQYWGSTRSECVHLNFLQFLGSFMHGKTNKPAYKFNGNHFNFNFRHCAKNLHKGS